MKSLRNKNKQQGKIKLKMRNKNLLITLFYLSFCVLISACSMNKEKKGEKYSRTKMLMGTFVQLDICKADQSPQNIELAYEAAWERLEDISWRMNVFDENSDVAKINNSQLNEVSIGEDTYQMLQDSKYFSDLSKGAFDITVWPLIQLWKNSEKNNQLPNPEEVRRIKQAIGLKNIELKANNRVKLLNPNTKIDLGGIAKGYAVDEVARIFRSHGIDDFYIDAGGDLYVGGQNCKGKPWHIGIRDPLDKSQIINIVQITNMAVATSGDYEQYYEIQNQTWSHIINPITGYPQKEVASATVISASAQDADALATALSVLGGQAGTALINSLKGEYASLIVIRKSENEILRYYSQGYKNFRAN